MTFDEMIEEVCGMVLDGDPVFDKAYPGESNLEALAWMADTQAPASVIMRRLIIEAYMTGVRDRSDNDV